MAREPKSEAEAEAMARALIEGLRDNPDLYPNPPVTPDQLEATLDVYVAAREKETRALDARDSAETVEASSFREIINTLRVGPGFGELPVGYDDDPEDMRERDRRMYPTPTEPPGQVRALEIPHQGKDWVYLDWKAPSDGGAVAHYRVERRDPSGGDWTYVTRTPDRDATLGKQERGKAWEYRVSAVNRLGQGEPSGLITCTL